VARQDHKTIHVEMCRTNS